MNIYLVNESTVVSDAEVSAWFPAFVTYLGHVRHYWPRAVTLKLGKPPSPDHWQVVLLDDSDQAGALGYHDYTPGGFPISRVFAKTDQDYRASVPVTLTHELAEMVADPWCSQTFQISDTKMFAQEIGDPVEADALGYKIGTTSGDVLCSDFVTPAWFVPGSPGPIYDMARHCKAPLQILPGGYMSVFVSCKGWQQVTARKDGRLEWVPLDEKGPSSRPARYGRERPHHEPTYGWQWAS